MSGPFAYPGWVYAFVIGFVVALLLGTAHAAIRPDPQPLSITPSSTKDNKPSCLQATTVSRLLVYPDGHKVIVGQFTIWQACK